MRWVPAGLVRSGLASLHAMAATTESAGAAVCPQSTRPAIPTFPARNDVLRLQSRIEPDEQVLGRTVVVMKPRYCGDDLYVKVSINHRDPRKLTVLSFKFDGSPE